MSKTMVVRDPSELEKLGLEVIPARSLLGSPDHQYWQGILDRWVERIPNLRIPYKKGGLPPGEHQLKYSALALCRRHNLKLWTVGCQKTATSLLMILGWYGEYLFPDVDWEHLPDEARMEVMRNTKPNVPPGAIHIVTRKKILKKTWMSELKRMGMDHLAEVVESESQLVNSKAPIILYHFDFPKLQTDKGKSMRSDGKGKRLKADGTLYFHGYSMAKLITKLRPPSLLIVDEIHRLRPASQSARTRELTHIRKKAKRVVGLTATPMDGWLVHYGAVLEFVYGPNTEAFPYESAEDFARRYTKTKVVTQDIFTGGETVGKKRPMPGVHPLQVPQFVKVTRHLAHRLTSKDPEVKKNVKFPPANFYRVAVEMDMEQSAYYQNLYEAHELHLKAALAMAGQRGMGRAQARANMLELINKLRMASACPTVLGYQGPPTQKFLQVLEICKKFKAEGRKVLIYTNFIEESREIARFLNDNGVGAVRLYVTDKLASPKSLNEEAQMNIIDRHEDEDEVVAMVSNLELIAEGLTLTWASGIINVSPAWRGNLYAQGLGRAIRPGQVWDYVDVYDLTNEGTIEKYIESMLKAKNRATAAFVDLDFSVQESPEIDAFELGQLLAQGVGA